MAYVYCIDAGAGNVCVKIPELKLKFLWPWDLWGPFGPWDIRDIEEKSPSASKSRTVTTSILRRLSWVATATGTFSSR